MSSSAMCLPGSLAGMWRTLQECGSLRGSCTTQTQLLHSYSSQCPPELLLSVGLLRIPPLYICASVAMLRPCKPSKLQQLPERDLRACLRRKETATYEPASNPAMHPEPVILSLTGPSQRLCLCRAHLPVREQRGGGCVLTVHLKTHFIRFIFIYLFIVAIFNSYSHASTHSFHEEPCPPRPGHWGAECQLSPDRDLQQLIPNDGIWEGAGQVSSAMFQACSEQSPEASKERNGKETQHREGRAVAL